MVLKHYFSHETQFSVRNHVAMISFLILLPDNVTLSQLDIRRSALKLTLKLKTDEVNSINHFAIVQRSAHVDVI